MKLFSLALKHLWHKKLRTLLTVSAMAVCIFMFCFLETAIDGINYGLRSANDGRLITRHSVSLIFNLPLTYGEKIAKLPGVERVGHGNWFGGQRKLGEFKDFFPNFAVDSDYLDCYPEYVLPPDQRRAYDRDRQGAIVGRELATKLGWKLGDRLQLSPSIPYYQTGRPYEFVVRGIYDTDPVKYPATNLGIMFLHWDYVFEATNRRARIGTYVTKLYDPREAGRVSQLIDSQFANSEAETKTETESAFRAGFVALVGDLALLLRFIGLAVTFTILLVTANTMSIALRERRTEVGVLKTLGFGSGDVMGLFLLESAVIGALGGMFGMGLGASAITLLPKIPVIGDAFRAFPNLGLSPTIALQAFAVAMVLGLAAGILPALLAYRARITETLRQI
ncbi:MAG: ABC transporter permease [Acidobacteriota bacterium]